MKRYAIVVLVVLAVIGFSVKIYAADSTGSVKFGYVDLNRALNEVKEGQTAKAKLEADGKAKKQKLEIMQNELKAAKEDLDKQRLVLPSDKVKEKEALLQQKFLELQKTSMEFEQQFGQAESNYIKPIGEKIQKLIQEIGKEDGFTMIVPKEVALYSVSGTDLTDKVINRYNSGK